MSKKDGSAIQERGIFLFFHLDLHCGSGCAIPASLLPSLSSSFIFFTFTLARLSWLRRRIF